jgi:hypothetical protein
MADETQSRNLRAEDTRGAGKVVSTPEGDNEYAPDQPLQPTTVEQDVDGLQRWPSNSAMEYDKDRASEGDEGEQHPHKGVQRVIDEISTGKILPG